MNVRIQQQTIRTRLLEISMKVEDCIYHKKAISAVEAEIFMREVTSYKAGCSTDERSLQVIEKLVRCMKAIISEHQETKSKDSSNDDHPYLYNENNGVPSPSYSLPEEDRTQLTQGQEFISVDTSNTDHNIPSNDNNINQYSNNNQIELAVKPNEITDVINLCDDDQVLIATNSIKNYTVNINTDSNIHKALSNLSINTLDDNDVDGTGCSQSVLHNFQAIGEFEQNTSNALSVDSLRYKVHTIKNSTSDNKKMVEPVSSEAIASISPKIFSNNECSPNILKNFNEFQQIKSQYTPVLNKINTNNNIVTKMPIQNEEIKITNVVSNFIKPTITKWNVKDTRAINMNNNQNDPLVDKVSKAINTTHIFGKPPNTIQTASFPNIGCNEKVNAININSVNNTSQNNTPVVINKKNDSSHFTLKDYNAYKAQNKIPKTNNTKKNIPRRGKKSNENSKENDNGTVKKKRAPRKKKTAEKVKEITNTLDLTGTCNNPKLTETGAMRTNSKKKRYNKNVLKEQPIPIYNRNVENDLSWIENIRFVREIDDNEYDGGITNLSHNFWVNFEMSPFLDDSDFLCY